MGYCEKLPDEDDYNSEELIFKVKIFKQESTIDNLELFINAWLLKNNVKIIQIIHSVVDDHLVASIYYKIEK